MTQHGDDKDLEDFMNRDSDISRRYRTVANEEPPADLDRAVLARARAAVEPLPPEVARFPVRSRTRWMVPFALAASVLLSFAIFREAGVDTGVLMSESSAPNDLVVTVPLAASDSSTASAPALAIEMPDAEVRKNADTREQTDSPSEAVGELARAASPAATPIPAAPPPEAEFIAPAQAPASKAIQMATTQPPPPAPGIAVANATRAAASGARQGAADRARNEADAARDARAPEVWLEEIRKLRAGGQTSEADTELKRFLEANPGYFDRNPDVARP